MRPILNSLWTINKSCRHQNNLRRWIHSGLMMTSQEVATALRPFIFTVHPDRFWNHPKEKNTNEISLKRLNEFLGDKSNGKRMIAGEETITFYIRNNNSNSNLNSDQIQFEKVDIKLNSKENISTTVHRILSQCSLPTDYLNKINQQTNRRSPSKTISSDLTSYQYRNEYFYNKDLFDDLKAEFKAKMEVNFSKWLKENYSIASKKIEASLPIRVELTRLKQELIDELDLIDLEWKCDWTVSHIRGALKNLSVLCKQYPEDLKKLNSKTVVFSRHNGVSFEGQVLLNVEDVRNNWLYLIRSIKNYDYYVKNIPVVEKELSDLLGGISIVHPEYNLWNAKKYFNQLARLIKSVRKFELDQGFPSNWPKSLFEHRLIVEFDSGPLMLSSTGDFIIPASCPVPLLVRFIIENMNKASQMLDKKEFNLEHERMLCEECIDTFKLGCLEKDVNITPEQMIDFCRRILDNKEHFEDYLKEAHIHVSMYYSVMYDGQICVPFNFTV